MGHACAKLCSPCGGGNGLSRRSVRRLEWNQDSEEFEELLAFLAAVPLFKKQLPKAELPKIAGALVKHAYSPGSNVVVQGQEGKAFFIIRSGEAHIIVKGEEDGEEAVRATLYHSDYFGGHTLTERRPNIATIKAAGTKDLEVLMLSREQFERLGLRKMLKFPRRPAIYDGHRMDSESVSKLERSSATGATPGPSTPAINDGLNEVEAEFFVRSLKEHPNLRAHILGVSAPNEEALREFVKTVRKTAVDTGVEIVKGGELANTAYVVAEGSFEVVPNALESAQHQSAEAIVASTSMTERLVRKQQFLIGLMARGGRPSTPKMPRGGVRGGRSKWEAKSEANVHPGNGRRGQLDVNQMACTYSMPNAPKLGPPRIDEFIQPSSKPSGRRRSFNQAMETLKGSLTQSDENIDSVGTMSTNIDRGFSRAMSLVPSSFMVRQTSEDQQFAFKVGDSVARVVVGPNLTKETGRVCEVLTPGLDGIVLVDFGDQGVSKVNAKCLRPTGGIEPIAVLERGDCIGELAMIYNTRQIATCRAIEDSAVYEFRRNAFERCFARDSHQTQELSQLLDEVHMLTPLLRSERLALARQAVGQYRFRPDEIVIRQGASNPEELWYVIVSGECKITKDGELLSKMGRGGHFGERSILRGEPKSEFTVQAGPEGLSCLVMEGEILRQLRLNIQGDSTDFGVMGINCDVKVYHERMPRRQESDKPLKDPEAINICAKLGEGGFGSVLLARSGMTDYALKRISKGFVASPRVAKQIVAERDILTMCDSPFIIHLAGTFHDEEFIYMLLEFVPLGNLHQLANDRPEVLLEDRPRGSAAMFYSASISFALEHLHDRNIMYRDLKLENVLLDREGYVKLCDLGFARFVFGAKKSTTLAGTAPYMAPEMIDKTGHDMTVDWWALGVLTFELLTTQLPFNDHGIEDAYSQMQTVRKQQETGIPDMLPRKLSAAKDFISKLLTVRVDRRLGSNGDGQEVRGHSWLAKYPLEDLLARKLESPWKVQRGLVVEQKFETPHTLRDVSKIPHPPELFKPYQRGDDVHRWDTLF